MTRTHWQRSYNIVFFIILLAIGCGCLLYSLSHNINLYFTPSELIKAELPGSAIKLGGHVVPGSVQRNPDKPEQLQFALSDKQQQILVKYTGILPDLFREQQMIVASGKYNDKTKYFEAQQILTRHDENYKPAVNA